MFTGIVQAVGKIVAVDNKGGDSRYSVSTPEPFLKGTQLGDSICVQGVCLTVVEVDDNVFSMDVSNETLQCTTLGAKKEKQNVNLETALTLATRLGGHLVSGHVDGVGEVKKISRDGDSIQLMMQSPQELAKYIARKGSICIDGVSLTVNEVGYSDFMVNIIPHTFHSTTIKEYEVNTKVNLEVDLLARYVERIQSYSSPGAK